jgi:hypothetical protein
MIPKSAALAAINLAEEFDKRKLVISADAGSPLGQLNETLAVGGNLAYIGSNPVYTPYAEFLEMQSSNFGGDSSPGINSHSVLLDALEGPISTYVRSHLSFAKNTVAPIVKELADNYAKDIAALPSDISFSMKVCVFDLPEPLQCHPLETEVTKYKDVNYYSMDDYLSLEPLSGQEVIESMVTGDSEVDSAISVWAAKLGDSFFAMVWSSVFTSDASEKRFNTLTQDLNIGVDAATAVFLLANRMYDNPPEKSGVTLSVYNDKIDQFRKQSALRIYQAFEEKAMSVKTKRLIKSFSKEAVTVNGEVYRKWIEEGGIDAILFGAYLVNNSPRFVDEINERRVELLERHERYSAYQTVTFKNNSFVEYKKILFNRTMNVVNNNFEACFGSYAEGGKVSVNMPEYQQFLVNFNSYCDTVGKDAFTDLFNIALCVACRCIFYKTDAEKILRGIDEACKANPKLSVSEAGLLSTIAYVSDYVCDQMSVSAF